MSAGADDEYTIYIQATFGAGLRSMSFPPHALLAPPGRHVGLTAIYPIRGTLGLLVWGHLRTEGLGMLNEAASYSAVEGLLGVYATWMLLDILEV